MKASKLSPETKARIAAHHEAATARMIASEAIALELLRAPVQQALGDLVLQLAHVGDDAVTLRRWALARTAELATRLASEFEHAALRARGYSRRLARGQVKAELIEGLALLEQLEGRRIALPQVVGASNAEEHDRASARAAGLALASRWSSLVFGAVSAWRRQEGSAAALSKAILGLGEQLTANVRVYAVDQAADAYQDERRAAWRDLKERHRRG